MELKGQMGVKDAAAFNALSAQKRFEKLDEVIKKNKDATTDSQNKWEARKTFLQWEWRLGLIALLKRLGTKGSNLGS
jgi:hypothetical protein